MKQDVLQAEITLLPFLTQGYKTNLEFLFRDLSERKSLIKTQGGKCSLFVLS